MTLQEPLSPTSVSELKDLHPLVIARIVVEWARWDRLFPMQMWGHEYLGSHVRIGDDKYFVGCNAQQAEIAIHVTRENEPTQTQTTWRIWLNDLKDKAGNAPLEEL